jgi:protein-disulfide isomerase
MSSVPSSRRGRKIVTPKRNPLVPFYIGVGAVLLIAVAFLITYMVRGSGANAIGEVNAPVGQTAEGYWYKGNPDAAVKVVAFEDYQCPACAFFNRNLGPIIDRDYVETGRVQFIYHEFPLSDIHPHAVAAGEAARCAGDQGRYWQMHDMLFQNQDQWSPLSTVTNVFSGYAGQLGLNRADFDACMSAGTHNAAVVAAGQAAIAAGAQATPNFTVNGQLVESSALPAAIEAALRAAGQ